MGDVCIQKPRCTVFFHGGEVGLGAELQVATGFDLSQAVLVGGLTAGGEIQHQHQNSKNQTQCFLHNGYLFLLNNWQVGFKMGTS